MRKRDDWIERVKRVETEYLAVALAVSRLTEHVRADPTVLPADIEPRDVARASAGLETTYFVRLYAVFEAGLREAWQRALGRDTQPPMRDLLDGVTSARGVHTPVAAAAHRVRESRNALVHERDDESTPRITLGEARRHLTRFFSFLPPDW